MCERDRRKVEADRVLQRAKPLAGLQRSAATSAAVPKINLAFGPFRLAGAAFATIPFQNVTERGKA